MTKKDNMTGMSSRNLFLVFIAEYLVFLFQMKIIILKCPIEGVDILRRYMGRHITSGR
jgi:hypothetical protein